MGFEEHLTEFAGLPVVHFPNGPDDPLPDPAGPVAWRIDTFPEWDMNEELHRGIRMSLL